MFVFIIQILIDTVLLYHEDFASHLQQFVEFVGCEFGIVFDVECHAIPE